ncbi:MAG: hypothetical protein ACRD8O_15045, partial [Bryobacteraceae bacterium]
VQYTLDGFNVGDPLTGRFESRMSVESVRTVEVYSGRFSAEFGKGSAGTLAIKTTPGDDKLRYSGTNFVPGLEDHKGWIIGNWTPRFNLSGPIVKGRAWLSNTIDARYDQHVVEEIPKGSDRTSSWRASNLLRGQVNLTPSNLLYAGFLTNYYNAPRSGLTALDPLSTTVDRRSRQWFVYLKDQIYLKRNAIVEFGVASNRTFGREIPQGWGPYLLTVEGRRGTHFLDAIRGGGRDQLMTNAFLPPVLKWGRHQIKAGVDLDRVSYSQDARRSELEYFNATGQMMRRITFGGSGSLSGRNLEASSYIQDAWRVRNNLTLEFGLRQDWDSLIGVTSVSPRQGFAWAPFGAGRIKISGGYAKVYDATSLRLFTRSLDQYQLTTEYRSDGTVRRGPAASLYSTDGSPLSRPHYHNWSLGAEQMLGAWMTRVQFLHRRGSDGFTYANTMTPALSVSRELLDYYGARSIDAVYGLTNFRRDEFDSLEFIVRRVFHKQYEWMASYTWSRAYSNAVLEITVDDPTRVFDNVGRMPWDSPHRLMSWGLIPMPLRNWSLAYLLDYRTGFPFSIQDDSGALREAVNSRRFPAYIEPNVHLERRFAMRAHNWAFRFGFNNVTGKRNPTVVDNNVVSPTFLHYYGGQGRSLNFRLRWLGRAK